MKNIQGPSNNWELVTRRILQEQLPEYDIDPHMRLANVVKGRAKFVRAMSQYEIDFTVRDKKTGTVICTVELDGPTHDTEDGRRRDENKNNWLAEAGISLIRIRHPDEAKDIRLLMGGQKSDPSKEQSIRVLMENHFLGSSQGQSKTTTPHETLTTDEFSFKSIKPRNDQHIQQSIKRFLAGMAVTTVGIFAIWFVFTNMLSNQQKRIAEVTQQAVHRAQPVENIPIQQTAVMPRPPEYERLLVRGKSAKECARPDGTLDNYTVHCMSDHYEMVLVNRSQ